jgi:hypothetical protein
MAHASARARVHRVDTDPPSSGVLCAPATNVRLASPRVLALLLAQGPRECPEEPSRGRGVARFVAIGVIIASIATFAGALTWLAVQ